MSEHNYTPLDPDEGPTAWARQHNSNRYSYTVAFGTDPTDPHEAFHLSAGEIRTLLAIVKDNREQ